MKYLLNSSLFILLILSGCNTTNNDAENSSDSDVDTAIPGDDTDIQNDSFTASSCGGYPANTGGASDVNDSKYTHDDYRGLSCIHWTLMDKGDLYLDFWEQTASCQKIVAGNFSGTDNELTFDLDFENADCLCCYDFTFKVPADSFDASKDLTVVSTWSDPAFNSHLPEDFNKSVLKISSASEGVECKYALADAGAIEHCSNSDTGLFGRCNIGGSNCSNDSLICTPIIPDYYSVCLPTCKTDDDCTLDGFTCKDDVCQLQSFLK